MISILKLKSGNISSVENMLKFVENMLKISSKMPQNLQTTFWGLKKGLKTRQTAPEPIRGPPEPHTGLRNCQK